jgi:acetolactate synthase I/II/III large subunit
MPLWGDAARGSRICAGPPRTARRPPPARVAPWCAEVAKRMAEWREMARARLESDEVPVSMGRLMGELNNVLPADAC